MLPAVTRTATAALTALAIAAASVTPAAALGKNERNVLKGVAAAVIVNELIKQGRANAAPQPQYPQYQPQYPQYQDPQYQQPQYQPPRHQRPQYQPPRHVQPTQIAAQTFYEYDNQTRRLIQQRLASYGYYRGSIDGVWGNGTSNAMNAYARDVRASQNLATRNGTIELYRALLS